MVLTNGVNRAEPQRVQGVPDEAGAGRNVKNFEARAGIFRNQTDKRYVMLNSEPRFIEKLC